MGENSFPSVPSGGFPMYGLDPSGNVVQYGSIDPDTKEVSVIPGMEDVIPSVSSGDALGTPDNPATVQVTGTPDYSEGLSAMQDDVAFLAAQQASSAGYLSSSALDTFDRVLEGYDYDYYCAYRYDDDQYNSIMYLSNGISWNGNTVTLEDALKVQLWRYRTSSNYSYQYYYSATPAGDTDITLANNLMYYTNTRTGYPVLGGVPAPSRYPPWLIPALGAIALFVVVSTWLRRIFS